MQPPYEPPVTPPDGLPVQPRKKRHWIRWTGAGIGTLIVAFVAIGVAAGGGDDGQPGPVISSPVTSLTQPTASPSPQVTTTRTVKQIIFKVRGTGDPDITYGTDSDNRDGGGHLGVLGSGNQLPWTRTLKFSDDALYYFVTAQLNGNGDISCTVTARVTAYYSDGTHESESQNVASGHAAGGYNICQAESS